MRSRPSAVDPRTTEDGSAVVDFVLVMLLLVPLVLGIVQIGLVLHVRNTLTAAASDGARAGAPLGANPDDAAARTRQIIRDALADRYAQGVSARTAISAGVPMVEVEVAAEVPALGLFGPAVPLLVDGHAVKEVAP
jgi:Flp pilus assembly protein TadG